MIENFTKLKSIKLQIKKLYERKAKYLQRKPHLNTSQSNYQKKKPKNKRESLKSCQINTKDIILSKTTSFITFNKTGN